jgi:hypothetical protein
MTPFEVLVDHPHGGQTRTAIGSVWIALPPERGE